MIRYLISVESVESMMVDITSKDEVYREAKAIGRIKLRKETIALIREGLIEKGDPLYAAKIAGVIAAKKTSSIIPLCHQVPLTMISIDASFVENSSLEIETTVKTKSQTGVEMEALLATTTALLTVWDMTKKYEKNDNGQYPYTKIEMVRVIQKTKGQMK